jgi:hypothetical protein
MVYIVYIIQASVKIAFYTANFQGIANRFRIFNEQNEIPDQKKIIKK